MWLLESAKHEYRAVASDEREKVDLREPGIVTQRRRPQRRYWVLLVVLISLVFAGAGFVVLFWVQSSSVEQHQDAFEAIDSADLFKGQSSTCPQRYEWRTLTATEQQNYINAVLCLRTLASIIAPNSNKTAYEDFPWIHSHVGYFTHNSAPFLPWHRYFLHVYETTLQEKCEYQGSLVYWDWTLDSDALEDSPVFDAKTGFGGDGEVGGEITVSRTGRCVIDGPFAGIEAEYYDVKYQPHCLSRGFRDLDGNLGHIDGHDITPESIEEVLSFEDYEGFVTLMESRVHDAIPYGISGDFETFTAPYGRHASRFVHDNC